MAFALKGKVLKKLLVHEVAVITYAEVMQRHELVNQYALLFIFADACGRMISLCTTVVL